MKKVTKTSLKRKLDKEVSRIVRARGVCARCGRGAEAVTLQCSHIIGRTHLGTRWSLDNCFALCIKCHLYWWHREPLQAAEWAKEYLGELKYNELLRQATAIKQWTVDELQELLKLLKEMG